MAPHNAPYHDPLEDELSVPERNEQARRERVAALIQHCRDVLHGTTKEQP